MANALAARCQAMPKAEKQKWESRGTAESWAFGFGLERLAIISNVEAVFDIRLAALWFL